MRKLFTGGAGLALVAVLTSGCSAGYICEHDYGYTKGTPPFGHCVAEENDRIVTTLATAAAIWAATHPPVVVDPPALGWAGPQLPVATPPQQLYCRGSVNQFGGFTANCD
jgi:hypothetical protein